MITPRVAFVTGASGQDGSFLVERLIAEGIVVHAFSRRRISGAIASHAAVVEHALEIAEPERFLELVAELRPSELYNLAGESSVARSLQDPLTTWETNATFVARFLDAVRLHSPETRVYQASSTDMFGQGRGDSIIHSEESPLNPSSPYAAAKAAAHMLCSVYRRQFGVRVTCGILSNHESHRRPAPFLSRKIVDHVRSVRRSLDEGKGYGLPLRVGNVQVERDWGFAPDYVEAIIRIVRQIEVRSTVSGVELSDEAKHYRDYVVGTGSAHAVWQMIDRAFGLAGIELEWHLADDPAESRATFASTSTPAVVVDRSFIRPNEPRSIRTDPSRVASDLGWSPRAGLDIFLEDMLRLREPHLHESAV